MKLDSSKTLATILLLMFIKTITFSQNIVDTNDLFFKNQIRFSLSPVLYDKLTINQFFGEKLLKSKPVFSGEATISYYKYLKKNIGLNIGAGLGLVPFYLNYYFETPENSIFNTNSEIDFLGDIRHYEYIQFIWTLPLSIQKIINKRQNKYQTIEAGVKLNSVVAHPYEIRTEAAYLIDDTTSVQLFEFNLANTKKFLISYFFKVGLLKINKKQNSLQLNGVLHFSFSKIGIGDYEFHNLGFKNTGQVGQNINYIGFEFIYGLTLSKRPKYKSEG